MRILTFAFCLLIFGSSVAAESAREYFKFAKYNYDLKDYTKALDFINAALDLEPGYTNGFLLRAEIYYNLGDYSKTIEDVSTALDFGKIAENTMAQFYLLRARSYYELDDFSSSVADINNCIKFDQNNTKAYSLKAEINIADNKLFLALEDLNKAISLDPGNIELYVKRADLKKTHYKPLGGTKTYERIMADIDKAISLDPNDHRPYKLRCEMLKLDSEVDKIQLIKELNEFISHFPEQSDFYSERGLANALSENFRAAYDDFSNAIELDNQNEANFRNRGLCQHNLGRYKAAVMDYTKSIDILAGKFRKEETKWTKIVLAQTLNMRGMSYEIMDSDEACDDFYNAAKLGSKPGLNNYRRNCRAY